MDAGGVVDLMVAQILKDIFLSVQVALSTEPMKQFFFFNDSTLQRKTLTFIFFYCLLTT